MCKTVDDLNDAIWDDIYGDDHDEDDGMAFVELKYYDGEAYVSFLGHPIWRSDEDERIELDVVDTYEPLCQYLERHVREIVNRIKQINI